MNSKISSKKVERYLTTKPIAKQVIDSHKWDLYLKGMSQKRGEHNAYYIFETHVQSLYAKILKEYSKYNNFPLAPAIALPQAYKPTAIARTSFQTLDRSLITLHSAHLLYTETLEEVKDKVTKLTLLQNKMQDSTIFLSKNPNQRKPLELIEIEKIFKLQVSEFKRGLDKKNAAIENLQLELRYRNRAKTPSIALETSEYFELRVGTSYIAKTEERFYKYYSKNPKALQESITETEAILLIVEQLKTGTHNIKPNPYNLLNKTKNLSTTGLNEAFITQANKETLSLLNPETKSIYDALQKQLQIINKNLSYLTVEQHHTLENIQNIVIPDGLHSIKITHRAELPNAAETEVRYVEILTLSGTKLTQIIEELQKTIQNENNQYYKSTIDILTKT